MEKEVNIKDELTSIFFKVGVFVAVPLGSLIYNAISDHIAIKEVQKDIQQIRYHLEHGKSRLYPSFIELKGKVKQNEIRSQHNSKWIDEWERGGELPLDREQNLKIKMLEEKINAIQ